MSRRRSNCTSVPLILAATALALAVMVGCAPGPVAKPAAPSVPAAPAPPDTNFAHSVPVTAQRGMVVSAHPLASRIGCDVLAQGGNAVDAALATVTALNVVEPQASGLGGGGFLLYYDKATDSAYVLDYRERALAQLNRAAYFQPSDTLHLVQRSGATSVLVPGAPAGWQAMHERWGTRLTSELLAPAIALADTGYPISDKQSAMILDYLAEIQADSGLARVFLKDSLPPPPGYRLKQPRLADLLRFLSRTRIGNLYYPPLSTSIVRTLASRGSTISQSDLTAYTVRDRVPLRGTYHGYEIITLCPPSSGGAALLEILRLVEPLDLKGMGYLSAPYIHQLSLASRQALKDADTWIADPDYHRVPIRALLSNAWLDTVRSRLPADTVPDRMTAMDSVRAFAPGNTTHLVVVDSAGNLVSLTQSVNYFFGSGLMVPDLGLILNNHMADFATDSTTIRAMSPFSRSPSNMAATLVRKNGKPVLVIGSPGGPRIAPTMAQVLISLLDFGLPLNQALDAPRFFPAGKTLVVENRIPQTTLDQLARKGWKIYPYGAANNYFGGVQAVSINPETGELTGASDPRRDGAPAGY